MVDAGDVEAYPVAVVGYMRLVVEAVGAAVTGLGVPATVYRYAPTLVGRRRETSTGIRLFLGRYLAVGLEFQLAADILGTAAAPTLDDEILPGAIAAIRTALDYSLTREPERERRGLRARTGDDRRRGPVGGSVRRHPRLSASVRARRRGTVISVGAGRAARPGR